jgi:Kef-type K+ transport system membrane component KefB
MPLLTSILFLLVAARALGELISRFGQPAIVGEILAGVILGPAVLGLIQPNDHLAGISELSVFLIVLSAGLEMEFRDVVSAFRGKGLVIALFGFFLPFVSGLALGIVVRLDTLRTIFLALCISVTALPVAVRILESFELLGTNIARYAIATAILNDIACLLCLGVVLDMPTQGPAGIREGALAALGAVAATACKLILFGLIVLAVSRLLRWGSGQTRYIERSVERLMEFFGREALFGVAVLFVLAFASIGETLGSHFVIGAFFGALLLSPDVFGSSLFKELENTLGSITGGFLAPVFFAFLGLHFSIATLRSPFFVLSVLAVSVMSKIAAGLLAGKIVRLGETESLGVGIILNGRGIMELVVANIALQRGFINVELFSTLVLMGVVTTVITPILFRRFVMPQLAPNVRPARA